MDKAIKMLTDIKNASSVFGIRPDEIDEALAELQAYKAKFEELEAKYNQLTHNHDLVCHENCQKSLLGTSQYNNDVSYFDRIGVEV